MEYNLALVLGGGKFGTIAFRALSKGYRRIIVIDKNSNCSASKAIRLVCSDPSKCDVGSKLIIDDAIAYTIKIMKQGVVPDIIVPAIPGNSMAMLFSRWLSDLGFTVKPDPEIFRSVLMRVPREVMLIKDESSATLVLSHAKGLTCNPWCDEPLICPVSGKRITESVYSILSGISFCTYNKVFRSKLVEKGVGGIDGREVFRELAKQSNMIGDCTLCIGTACNCHGIITFLKVFTPHDRTEHSGL